MTEEHGRATVPTLLRDAAQRHGDRPWLCTDDLELTFAEAVGRIGGIAGRLREIGAGHEDTVLLTARNTPSYLLSLLAVTALGACAVPVNPDSTPHELAGILGQLDAGGRLRAVITDDRLRGRLSELLADCGSRAELVDVAELGDVDELASSGPLKPCPAAFDDVSPDTVAVMIPTSGTTGRCKLVTQTHRAHVLSGEGFPHWMQLRPDDRLMTALPIFHTNALCYSTMGSLAAGLPLVLLPRFSASTFLDSAKRHGATSFNAVGAMLDILLRRPEHPEDASNPVRVAYSAPAPGRDDHLEIERRFGLRLVCGYGMSESPYGLIWPHGGRPFGELGVPRQHPTLGVVNQARVIDERGRDVEPGQVGELLLRNPTVTPGYYGMPEETAAAVRDGWLHTGDLVAATAAGSGSSPAARR